MTPDRKGRSDPPFSAAAAAALVLLAAGEAAAQSAPASETCQTVLAQPVTFPSDKTTLDAAARAHVRRQAQCLAGSSGPITLEAYWDDSSTKPKAIGLSERLAERVKAELARHGVDERRIAIRAHGRDRGVDPQNPFDHHRAVRVVASP